MYLRGDEVTNHKGRVSISIFIRSPVILAFSLPSIKMSWKWLEYAVLNVIIEVSANTVAKRSDNRFHTASSRAVVTKGFSFLLTGSGRRRTCAYR